MTAARHIHLQPLGGIAGDMFAAAMLDAFPELVAQVFADVAAVLPATVGTAQLARVARHGITANHFSLAEPGAAAGKRYRRRAPAAGSFAAGASAAEVAGPQPGTYRVLRQTIEAATLSGSTATHALGILRVLAEAEAAIHGVAVDDVHFHELAGWDSLMDVVAAGSVISGLGAATWSADPLPLGGGRVSTRHGPLPVPPPATALILQGYPWQSDGIGGERVTPTGAAIVRYLVAAEPPPHSPGGTLLATGYGAGTRELPGLANVLRVMAFAARGRGAQPESRVAVLQFDIDDMSGEEIGIAADRLRALPGLLDLLLVPAQGKKARPVTMFQLLVAPDAVTRCADAVFAETSTIGLRWSICERLTLPREVLAAGDGGRVKEVRRPGGRLTRKAESDDLRAIDGLAARRASKSRREKAP